MNWEPKRTFMPTKYTTGLPKGGNTYGNRVPILSVAQNGLYASGNSLGMRRGAGFKSFSRFMSSAVQPIKYSPKLEKVIELSSAYPGKKIDRNIYQFLLDKNMYLIAYDKLKSKPGNMSPGLNPETLDGISSEWIDGVIAE